MKLEKIFFILSILGILTIILLAQFIPRIYSGKIESIQHYDKRTIIRIENFQKELIIFNTIPFEIKKGDNIEFQGKSNTYKNQEQIIVDKIILC